LAAIHDGMLSHKHGFFFSPAGADPAHAFERLRKGTDDLHVHQALLSISTNGRSTQRREEIA
jgi:hypothetical protein